MLHRARDMEPNGEGGARGLGMDRVCRGGLNRQAHYHEIDSTARNPPPGSCPVPRPRARAVAPSPIGADDAVLRLIEDRQITSRHSRISTAIRFRNECTVPVRLVWVRRGAQAGRCSCDAPLRARRPPCDLISPESSAMAIIHFLAIPVCSWTTTGGSRRTACCSPGRRRRSPPTARIPGPSTRWPGTRWTRSSTAAGSCSRRRARCGRRPSAPPTARRGLSPRTRASQRSSARR